MMWLAPVILAAGACLPIASNRDRITAADLAAADGGFASIPGDTSIGYAPAPGVRRIFGVAELNRIAARYGCMSQSKGEICLERPLEKLTAARLIAAMRESLGMRDVRIDIVQFSRYPVPKGDLEFPYSNLSTPSTARPRVPVLWKGFVRYGSHHRFAVWARVWISGVVRKVVATETLRPGRPIEASQLRVEQCEGFPLRNGSARSLKEVVGRVPRHSIPAGSAVQLQQVEEAPDVSRGDTVRIEVRWGRARVELDGRAEANGRRGESIPVRNLTSGKRFTARVAGRGRVVLNDREVSGL